MMRFVFLMDPLGTVVFEKDTSFILMLGAHRRGHKIFFVPDGGLSFCDGQVRFHAIVVTPQDNKAQPFLIGQETVLTGGDVDAVFVRNDPPFDDRYLVNTWMLDRLPPSVVVINSAQGIRTVNEKIWAGQFTGLVPSTLISGRKDELIAFVNEKKDVIAKPVDGYGGQGVFRVQAGGPNTNVILETLTAKWTRDIVLQVFVPESQKGDKRVLLLDGEPLGAVLRVHSGDDHRNNFFSGGKPYPADITARDREIISALKPHLQALGLMFVGIDIIGDHLIEVNVTSPTCLQEMNRLSGVRLEDRVIDFVEKKVQSLKRS